MNVSLVLLLHIIGACSSAYSANSTHKRSSLPISLVRVKICPKYRMRKHCIFSKSLDRMDGQAWKIVSEQTRKILPNRELKCFYFHKLVNLFTNACLDCEEVDVEDIFEYRIAAKNTERFSHYPWEIPKFLKP